MKKIILVFLIVVTPALFSCDDKPEEEDAGPDGGCALECDDSDWGG